jgi:hypothetical protein
MRKKRFYIKWSRECYVYAKDKEDAIKVFRFEGCDDEVIEEIMEAPQEQEISVNTLTKTEGNNNNRKCGALSCAPHRIREKEILL